MWTPRIVLLITLLLTSGGWFDTLLPRGKKAAVLVLLPALFALSFVPTLREPVVRVCAAPCAFALFAAVLCPTEHPFGALAAAMLGGVVGWKLCDALPLFPEQGFLIAAPTVLTAMLYGRDRNARLLAIAAAPFVMLLLRSIGDYTLFKSAVLELGDADAFAAQTMGLFFMLLGTAAFAAWQTRTKRAKTALFPGT